MALTRAQLLMGNSAQGVVLPGQVQAVKQGAGIAIAPDGTISVDATTVVGLMKMGQTPATAAAAYNQFEWPVGVGLPGQVVKIDSTVAGVTRLKWDTAVPWTAKGQLAVGTGPGTETLLNAGVDGSILIADSTTVSGLAYTTNYVSTSGAQGGANIPAGTTGDRPTPPALKLGSFRLNTSTGQLEFWNGTGWKAVPSSDTGLFVEKTANTGSAIIPSGTIAQRDTAPIAGFFRFNDDTDAMEFYDGVSWQKVASSTTGAFVAQTVPVAGSPSAVIPAGTTAQRQTFPSPGFVRWNTDLVALEVWNGTTWDNTSDEVDSFSAGTTGFTPAVPTKGDIVLGGSLNVSNGGTGATNAVQAINNLLPIQGGNNGFYLVTNGTNVSWQAPPSMVNTFSAGSTGFNPAAPTSGNIVLSGSLNVANGGTGATTASQALNNLLPSQPGNAGKYLTTDGGNASWSAITSLVTSFSAGTTGLTPAAASTGAVILGGTLNISNGGTNATTRNSALNNLLPSQGGNTNKVLTTDGTNASWQPATSGGGVTQLIAGTGILLNPTTGTGTVTISTISPYLDFYTQRFPGFTFADLPFFPGELTTNVFSIPAGYTQFFVISTLSVQAKGDTTLFDPTNVSLSMFEQTTNTPIGFSTVQFTKTANVDNSKVVLTAIGTFVGSVGLSYTFVQKSGKGTSTNIPPGVVIIGGDSALTVLAFKP